MPQFSTTTVVNLSEKVKVFIHLKPQILFIQFLVVTTLITELCWSIQLWMNSFANILNTESTICSSTICDSTIDHFMYIFCDLLEYMVNILLSVWYILWCC